MFLFRPAVLCPSSPLEGALLLLGSFLACLLVDVGYIVATIVAAALAIACKNQRVTRKEHNVAGVVAVACLSFHKYVRPHLLSHPGKYRSEAQ